jgi:hypothetical protein
MINSPNLLATFSSISGPDLSFKTRHGEQKQRDGESSEERSVEQAGQLAGFGSAIVPIYTLLSQQCPTRASSQSANPINHVGFKLITTSCPRPALLIPLFYSQNHQTATENFISHPSEVRITRFFFLNSSKFKYYFIMYDCVQRLLVCVIV